MNRIASLRVAAVLGLALAAALPAAVRAEAEARFAAVCAAESGRSASACSRIAEALQSRLGYEGFLAAAHRGPAGFGADAAGGTLVPANPVLAAAAPSFR